MILARLLIGAALLAISTTATAETGFRDTDSRVASSYDVLRFFHWKFHLPEDYSAGENSCEKLGFTEHIIAGTLISTVQTRLIQAPEPVFEEWYAGCAVKFAQVKLAMIVNAPHPGKRVFLMSETFGPEIAARFALDAPWMALPSYARKAFIAHLIESWVGPEFVVEDLGLTGPMSTLVGKPKNLVELIDLLEKLPTDAGADPKATLAAMYEFFALTLLTLPELRIH